MAIFSSLGLIFDLVVFFVCCVGVNSELGYLSPGEYKMHSNVAVFERVWHMRTTRQTCN